MNWLKQLFTRRRRYDELSESIREHLEEKLAGLIGDGMMREEAEQVARRKFGNVTRIEESAAAKCGIGQPRRASWRTFGLHYGSCLNHPDLLRLRYSHWRCI